MKTGKRALGSPKFRDSMTRYLHWSLLVALLAGSLLGFFAPDEYWAQRLAFVSLLVLVLQLLHCISRLSSVSFELWFLLASWLFMFGQVWLVGLAGEDLLFYPLLLRYETNVLTQAGAYALCYMQGLFLGLTARPMTGLVSRLGPPRTSAGDSSWRLATSIGVVLTVSSLPFRLFEDVRNVTSAQISGSFLAVTTSSGAADDLGKLFVPGLLALMVGARERPILRLSIFWVGMGYHLAVMLLSGDRRYAVTAILALALCHLAHGASTHWRKWAGYSLGALALLNLLAYIRSIRQGELTSLGELFREGPGRLLAMNPILESFSEFGVSLMSVVLAVIYVPSIVPYQLGYSYAGAALTILPIGSVTGADLSGVSIGDVLAGLDGHAVGAAPAAELYANFGWWGLIGSVVLGRLLAWCFRRATNLPHPVGIIVYYSLFYILLNLARAAFVEMLRASILVAVSTVLLALVLRRPSTRHKSPRGLDAGNGAVGQPSGGNSEVTS